MKRVGPTFLTSPVNSQCSLSNGASLLISQASITLCLNSLSVIALALRHRHCNRVVAELFYSNKRIYNGVPYHSFATDTNDNRLTVLPCATLGNVDNPLYCFPQPCLSARPRFSGVRQHDHPPMISKLREPS